LRRGTRNDVEHTAPAGGKERMSTSGAVQLEAAQFEVANLPPVCYNQ
jgi:hypothetical protein